MANIVNPTGAEERNLLFIERSAKFVGTCVDTVDLINLFVFTNIFNSQAFLGALGESSLRGSLHRVGCNQARKIQDIAQDYEGRGFLHGFLLSCFSMTSLKYRIHVLGSAILCGKDMVIDSIKALFYTIMAIGTLFLLSSNNHNMQKNWWKVFFDAQAIVFCLLDIISRKLTFIPVIGTAFIFLYYIFVAVRSSLINLIRFFIIQNREEIDEWIRTADTEEGKDFRKEFIQNIARLPNLKRIFEFIFSICQATTDETIRETMINNCFHVLNFVQFFLIRNVETSDVEENREQLISSIQSFFSDNPENFRASFENVITRLSEPRDDQLDNMQIIDLYTLTRDMQINQNFERARRNSSSDVEFIKNRLEDLLQRESMQRFKSKFNEEKISYSPNYLNFMGIFVSFEALRNQHRESSCIKDVKTDAIQQNQNAAQWQSLCEQYNKLSKEKKTKIEEYFYQNTQLLLFLEEGSFLEEILPSDSEEKELFTQLLAYSYSFISRSNATFNALVMQL